MNNNLSNDNDAVASVLRPFALPRPGAVMPAPPSGRPIEVSLTKIADFILKVGAAKVTVVKEVKSQLESDYDPLTDFYKRLRGGLVDYHTNGRDRAMLDRIATMQTSDAKQRSYPECIAGYKKFLGRKKLTWFTPPRAVWSHGDLVVRVNPELGLAMLDQKLAVKLYLRKGGALNKVRASLITHLMQLGFDGEYPGVTPCVLDVRTGKNFPACGVEADVSLLLRAEATAFVEIFRNI